MTISKKLFFITALGLYVPFITLTSEKPNYRTTQKYSITKFDPTRDKESVVNLFNKEKSLLQNFYPARYLQRCHHSSDCEIKILRENNEFAGFIGYDSFGHIDYLAVEKNFRGKKYGKKLLTHSIKNLQDKGIKSITIYATKNNIPALTLYEKIGFKKKYGEPNSPGELYPGELYLEYNTSIIQTALSHLIKVQKHKEHI
jgi:ribosomal protein S18 acetylase RimI-like enzyme